MQNQNKNTNVVFSDSGTQQSAAPVNGVKSPPPDMQAFSLEPIPGGETNQQPTVAVQSQKKTNPFVRLAKRADVILAFLLIVGSIGLVLSSSSGDSPTANTASDRFETTEIPLDGFVTPSGVNFGSQSVIINGPLQANDSFIISPSLQPTSAKMGQIYYDQGTNQLAYYNGTQFVPMGGAQLSTGAGLVLVSGQISNSGVLSVQGLAGNVSFSAGNGIAIDGTTISNSGIVSVTSSTPALTVTNDGNGNVTLTGSGAGTVSSPGGTAGRVPLFTGSQTIENSIISQSGLTVTINGDLSVVTGGLTLSNALTVSNGGTGATSLALNGVLVGQGTGAITSLTAGGAGLCLVSTAGAPTWSACPGGSGVNSVNGQTGTLTIANASGASGTITIDNSSTSVKGIAQFNATNFSVGTGIVNTIQNINTGATPTFAGVNTNSITPSAALTVGATGQQLTLQGNGSTALTATADGFTTTVGFTGTAVGNVTYRFDRTVAVGSYDICTTAANCTGTGGGVSTPGGITNRLAKFTAAQSIDDSTITDDGTNVTTSVDLVIQGGSITVGVPSSQTGTIVFAHSGSANTGTIVQGALTGNRTYTLPDANGELCLSIGNCSGSGSTNTLQAAYAAGSIISTTDARDVDIELANTTTDSNFDIVVKDDSTGFVSISRENGTGTNNPAQLLLIDNLDGNQAIADGVTVRSAAGTITDGVDVSDPELVNAINVGDNVVLGGIAGIDFTNFDVGGTGNITAGGNMNLSGGGQYQVSGVQISSANLSNDANLAKLNASQTFTGNSNAFQNGTNSTNAFNVQNAAGTRIMTVDSSNGEVELGVGSALSGRLVFNNVTNTNTVTIVPGTPTGNRTITLPDSSGIVCLDSGNCNGVGATLQTAYNFSTGGTTPKIKVNSTLGGVDIQDADSTIGANLLNIRASNASGLGSVMFGVSSSGQVTAQNATNSTTSLRVLTAGGTSVFTVDTQNGQTLLGQGGTLAGSLVFRNATNTNIGTLRTNVLGQDTVFTLPDPVAASAEICVNTGNCLGGGGGANAALSNLSGVAINTTLLPGAAGTINLGSATLPFGDVFLAGTSGTPGTNNFRITGASTSGTRTITLPDASGTVCLQASTACAFAPTTGGTGYIQNSTTQQTANYNITSGAGTGVPTAVIEQVDNSTAGGFGLQLIAGASPTVNVLHVQNSSGTQIFGIDASNSRTIIGSGTGCSGRLCVGQSATGSGAVFNNLYNTMTVNTSGVSTVNLHNVQLDDDSSSVANVINLFTLDTTASSNASAIVNTLTAAVDSGQPGNFINMMNGGSSVLTLTNAGNMTLQPTTNSTTTFRVQNAAATTTVINADTTNGRLGINTQAPSERLTVNGNFNIRDADSATKQHRLRTSGSALDFESAGANLNLSTWDNADFTGSQRTRLVFVNASNETVALGQWNWYSDLFGSLRHQIDGTATGHVRFNVDGVDTNFIVQGGGDANLLYVKGFGDMVGIGTDTPAAKLHVSSAGTDALFRVTDATASAIDVFNIANEGAVTFRNRTDSTTALQVQNSAAATVLGVDTTNQRIGINTASPSTLLQVNQSNLTPGTVSNSASSASVTGSSTTFFSTFQRGDTFTITSSGNSCTILSITSDTALTCTATLASSSSGSAYSFTQQARVVARDNGTTSLNGTVIISSPSANNQFTLRNDTSTNTLNIGSSIIGNASNDGGADSNASYIQATKFNSGPGGTVSSLRVFFPVVDGVSPGFKVAIYSDSAGSPNSLLSSATAPSTTATASVWSTASLGTTVTLTPNTDYWLATTQQSGSTQFRRQTGGTNTSKYQSGFTYSNNFPATYTVTDTTGDYIAIYGAYITITDQSNVSSAIKVSENNEVAIRALWNSDTALEVLQADGTQIFNVNTIDGWVGAEQQMVGGVDTNYTLYVAGNHTNGALGVRRTSSTATASILELFSDNGGANTLKMKVTADGTLELAGGGTKNITTAAASTATAIGIQPGDTTGSNGTGAAVNLTAGAETSGTCGTACTGGAVTIQGGSATGGSGTRNGGSVSIEAGTGASANGSINIGTNNSSDITMGRTTSSSITTIQAGSHVVLQSSGSGSVGRVQIGAGGAGSATPDYFALDVKSSTGDPAGGAEGYMYYNTVDNKFRCFQGAAWTDCIGAGGSSDLDSVYDNDSDKELLIDNATGLIFDMTTTGDFLIQDANATIATFANTGGITLAPTSGQDIVMNLTGDGILDINPTTFVDTIGAVDIARSGNFTGTDGGVATELRVAPSLTLTEPATGTFTWIGQTINMANIAVTAGAGSSIIDGLRILVPSDGDIGTVRGMYITGTVQTGATQNALQIDSGWDSAILANGKVGIGNITTPNSQLQILTPTSAAATLGVVGLTVVGGAGGTGDIVSGGHGLVATGGAGGNGAVSGDGGGEGGGILLTGGNGGNGHTAGFGGTGGSVTITAGNSGTGGSVNGGNITLVSGSGNLSGVGGMIVLRAGEDATTAIQFQNASTTPVFSVDTVNNRLYLGNPTGDTTAVLSILDTKTSSGDPTGVNGAIYYNTGGTGGAGGSSSYAGKLRCFEGNIWKNCMGMRDVAERRWGYANVQGTTATGLTSLGITARAAATGTAAANVQTESFYARFTDAGTANSDAGYLGGPFSDTRTTFNPKFSTRIRVDATSVGASTRYWVGLFESTPMGFDVPTTDASQSVAYLAVGYRDNVNNGEWVCASGDNFNHSGVDTNVVVTAGHYYDIIIDYTSTNGLVCSISDNGGAYTSVSKTDRIPGAQDLGVLLGVRSVTAVTRAISVAHFFLEYQ